MQALITLLYIVLIATVIGEISAKFMAPLEDDDLERVGRKLEGVGGRETLRRSKRSTPSAAEIETLLSVHNNFRRQEGASDMNVLVRHITTEKKSIKLIS